MRLILSSFRIALLTVLFLMAGTSAVLARSWSYHYHPQDFTPTPMATPTQAVSSSSDQASIARFLKRAIISDLAIFAAGHATPSAAAYSDRMAYVTSRLALFDSMNSADALSVFASLSGYYLGSSGEKLYACLALRKGAALGPYLAHYLGNGNAECSNELGQDFTKPSVSLDGYALCSNQSQEGQRLSDLIARINSGEVCADSELAQIRAAAR
jgi:hypothetical protein